MTLRNESVHPPANASVQSTATSHAVVRSLDDWCGYFGAPDPDVHEELFSTVSTADLIADGRHADSAMLIDAMPAFLASVIDSGATLTDAQKALLVGYDASFLPVLAHETVTLRGLYARFNARDAAVAREIARRRTRASEAWSACIAIRDQAVRNLRRAVGSDAAVRAQLDEAVGDARSIETLVAGTRSVASTLAELLATKDASGKKPSVLARLLVRAKLDDALVKALREAATTARETHDAASAAGFAAVTQDDLDAQDGRVMRVVEWTWRAFREAARRDAAIREPALGAMDVLFVRRSTAKSDETPADDNARDDAQKPVD